MILKWSPTRQLHNNTNQLCFRVEDKNSQKIKRTNIDIKMGVSPP